jgi:hypothetical protein
MSKPARTGVMMMSAAVRKLIVSDVAVADVRVSF